ncbi:hypothetical protein BGZ54_005344, partial [Gamsiella multidivaricata]
SDTGSESDGSETESSDDEEDETGEEMDSSEEDEEGSDPQILLLHALSHQNSTGLQPISMNELALEEIQENIRSVFFLMRVPTIDEEPENVKRQVLLAQPQTDGRGINIVHFVSDQYGFCLEAPRCRDIVTNTPVKLIPGLEERNVFVGDLPEVDARMEEIHAMFDRRKGCFPLSGEMSRTLDSTKLQAPAEFHTDPSIPLPKAYSRKYSPEQIRVLNEYVETMERAGKMQKSNSPVSCNPLLVAKKDGSYRVCVNFIPVNKLIRPMAWPIPDPMTEIYKLQG